MRIIRLAARKKPIKLAWTDRDAEILVNMAHKIKRAAAKKRGYTESGGYPVWPLDSYIPSQRWVDTLNL